MAESTDLFPALVYLARAYLHPDFELEYDDDPSAAVDDFLKGSPDRARVVRGEIDLALATRETEKSVRTFVLDELDSSYLVEADGLTYRGWLQSIADRARELGY